MRVYDGLMSSDLPILNAEQYVGAAGIRLTEKAEKAKKGPAARSEEGPRKRPKTSSKAAVADVDGDDADENAKRARGRPRLDTKDQNAADVGPWPSSLRLLPRKVRD